MYLLKNMLQLETVSSSLSLLPLSLLPVTVTVPLCFVFPDSLAGERTGGLTVMSSVISCPCFGEYTPSSAGPSAPAASVPRGPISLGHPASLHCLHWGGAAGGLWGLSVSIRHHREHTWSKSGLRSFGTERGQTRRNVGVSVRVRKDLGSDLDLSEVIWGTAQGGSISLWSAGSVAMRDTRISCRSRRAESRLRLSSVKKPHQ